MKIYVVSASTGEYSDRTEWQLHAYRTEEQAKAFVNAADHRFKELWAFLQNIKHTSAYYDKQHTVFAEGWLPEAPTLGIPDYTGYYFWYEKIELKD